MTIYKIWSFFWHPPSQIITVFVIEDFVLVGNFLLIVLFLCFNDLQIEITSNVFSCKIYLAKTHLDTTHQKRTKWQQEQFSATTPSRFTTTWTRKVEINLINVMTYSQQPVKFCFQMLQQYVVDFFEKESLICKSVLP